jgi:hypothetical protein
MIRQAEDLGAGRARAGTGSVGGSVIDHQNRGFPHYAADFADNAGDGADLIKSRDQY